METQRERNYYELLGLPVGATEEQIKQAYHELARKYHPDKALEPDEAERFEQEFALISRAYNTLKDADKRKLYLDMLKREKERSVKPVERPIPTTTKVRAPTADKASIAKKSFLRGMQFFGAKDYNKAIEFFEVR